jgi:streptogramin lyase
MSLRTPLALVLTVVAALPARAVLPITTEPTSTRPTRIASAPNGYLYWTDLEGNKLGYRSPTGTIVEIALASGTLPRGIAAAPDGTIWFAEAATAHIARFNPNFVVGDPFTEFPVEGETETPHSICAGPDGNMWFTSDGGGKVGRITLAGVVTEWSLPTTGAKPTGIALGSDGAIWFSESNAARIGRITTSGTITEYELESTVTPGAMTRGPDGNIWFVSRATRQVGRVSRSLFGVVTTSLFTLPVASQTPESIAAGPDGALWIVGGGTLTRMTTGGGYDTFALGRGTDLVVGPDGALWIVHAYATGLIRFSIAGDVNHSGLTNVSDVFYLINFLFAGGPAPL